MKKTTSNSSMPSPSSSIRRSAAVLCCLAFAVAPVWHADAQNGADTDWGRRVKEIESSRMSRFDNPELAVAYNNYALQLADEERYDEAVSYLEKAYKINPKNNRFATNLSRIYFEKASHAYRDRQSYTYKHRQFQAIQSDLNKAVRIDPEFAEAYLLMGDIAYDSQKLKQAGNYWMKARKFADDKSYADQRLERLYGEEPIENNFNSVSAAYFDLRYDRSAVARTTGFDVRSELLNARRLVGADFKYWPKHSIIVLLYSVEQYRNNLTQSPEWSGAIYDGKIRIPISSDDSDEALIRRTIRHEYTHALVHDLTSGNCPKWFNEGLAMYQEYKKTDYGAQALSALLNSNSALPAWGDNLNDYFSGDRNSAQLGYELSHSIVAYLEERYGFWRMRNVLADLNKGVTLEDSFEKHFKTPMDRLRQRWEAWLPRFVSAAAVQ